MQDDKGSGTALGASAMRTVHQLLDELPHILEDPVSPRLLDEALLDRIRKAGDAHRTRESPGLRSHIVLRSRYAEDELRAAVGAGVGQFISLGAGYDTFPYRQPEWAMGLRILEIDHPATQKEKRELFAARDLAEPGNLAFLPLDLERRGLREALSATSMVDLGSPLWVSCLGVLAYLRRQTVSGIFESIAGLPKGSGIVFAFAPEKTGALDQPAGAGSDARAPLADRVSELGEPWLTRYTVAGLRKELDGLGFASVSFLEASDAESRYYRGRTDLPAPRQVRLCRAVVG